MKRLNPASDVPEEIVQYYTTRALQLKPYGFELSLIQQVERKTLTYALAIFLKDGKTYISFYLYASFRGKRKSQEFADEIKYWLDIHNAVALTAPECKLATFFTRHNIRYHYLENSHLEYLEYKLISDYYGDQKAKRSNLYLMNHVDEGIAIMLERGASEDAIKAFIAHPMFQDDEHFLDCENLESNIVVANCSKKVILLCAEYRKVANAFLCKPHTDNWDIDQIRDVTSIIIKDVHEMLVADKVQNHKDFLQHHALSHPRRSALFSYFNKWFQVLDCQEYAENWISNQNIVMRKT